MNKLAVRDALRSPFGNIMAALTAGYVAVSFAVGTSIVTATTYAIVFAAYTVVVFGLRYNAYVDNARRVERDARTDAVLAEHRALMSELQAERDNRISA